MPGKRFVPPTRSETECRKSTPVFGIFFTVFSALYTVFSANFVALSCKVALIIRHFQPYVGRKMTVFGAKNVENALSFRKTAVFLHPVTEILLPKWLSW